MFILTSNLVKFHKVTNSDSTAIVTLSKTSLWLRHTLSRQPNGRKFPYVQRDIRYGDFGSHCKLKIESSSFIMMMEIHASLFDDDATSKMF
jgi:hypothetical protein